MGLTLQIELSDDQLEEMENRLFERLQKANPDLGKRKKPYTVREASKVLPWSERTIRDKIAANLIRTVEGMKPYLIPASEIEYLTK